MHERFSAGAATEAGQGQGQVRCSRILLRRTEPNLCTKQLVRPLTTEDASKGGPLQCSLQQGRRPPAFSSWPSPPTPGWGVTSRRFACRVYALVFPIPHHPQPQVYGDSAAGHEARTRRRTRDWKRCDQAWEGNCSSF